MGAAPVESTAFDCREFLHFPSFAGELRDHMGNEAAQKMIVHAGSLSMGSISIIIGAAGLITVDYRFREKCNTPLEVV